MAFPIDLTSVLCGASVHQLRRWRRTIPFIPEARPTLPPLYSFRDVVALRTIMRLRAETSLQKIRTAIQRMPEYGLTEHMSTYMFAVHGKDVMVDTDEGWLDIVDHPGQYELLKLWDIYKPFTTNTGVEVVDFLHPRPHLEVNARKASGWPVVEKTRISYDTIANLIDNVTVFPADVARFYPGVDEAAANDAVSLDKQVRAQGGRTV